MNQLISELNFTLDRTQLTTSHTQVPHQSFFSTPLGVLPSVHSVRQKRIFINEYIYLSIYPHTGSAICPRTYLCTHPSIHHPSVKSTYPSTRLHSRPHILLLFTQTTEDPWRAPMISSVRSSTQSYPPIHLKAPLVTDRQKDTQRHTHTDINIDTNTHKHTHTHTHKYTHTQTHTQTHTHTHTHTNTHKIHTHTHTHTYT